MQFQVIFRQQLQVLEIILLILSYLNAGVLDKFRFLERNTFCIVLVIRCSNLYEIQEEGVLIVIQSD